MVSNRRVQGAGRVLAEVGDMTNQLTHTDADITTLLVPASLPLPTSPAVNGGEPHWPTRSGRRWMLLAGGIALAATAVLGVAAAGNGPSNTVKPSTDQRSASAIVQDEIDAAPHGTQRVDQGAAVGLCDRPGRDRRRPRGTQRVDQGAAVGLCDRPGRDRRRPRGTQRVDQGAAVGLCDRPGRDRRCLGGTQQDLRRLRQPLQKHDDLVQVSVAGLDVGGVQVDDAATDTAQTAEAPHTSCVRFDRKRARLPSDDPTARYRRAQNSARTTGMTNVMVEPEDRAGAPVELPGRVV